MVLDTASKILSSTKQSLVIVTQAQTKNSIEAIETSEKTLFSFYNGYLKNEKVQLNFIILLCGCSRYCLFYPDQYRCYLDSPPTAEKLYKFSNREVMLSIK